MTVEVLTQRVLLNKEVMQTTQNSSVVILMSDRIIKFTYFLSNKINSSDNENSHHLKIEKVIIKTRSGKSYIYIAEKEVNQRKGHK